MRKRSTEREREAREQEGKRITGGEADVGKERERQTDIDQEERGI